MMLYLWVNLLKLSPAGMTRNGIFFIFYEFSCCEIFRVWGIGGAMNVFCQQVNSFLPAVWWPFSYSSCAKKYSVLSIGGFFRSSRSVRNFMQDFSILRILFRWQIQVLCNIFVKWFLDVLCGVSRYKGNLLLTSLESPTFLTSSCLLGNIFMIEMGKNNDLLCWKCILIQIYFIYYQFTELKGKSNNIY